MFSHGTGIGHPASWGWDVIVSRRGGGIWIPFRGADFHLYSWGSNWNGISWTKGFGNAFVRQTECVRFPAASNAFRTDWGREIHTRAMGKVGWPVAAQCGGAAARAGRDWQQRCIVMYSFGIPEPHTSAQLSAELGYLNQRSSQRVAMPHPESSMGHRDERSISADQP